MLDGGRDRLRLAIYNQRQVRNPVPRFEHAHTDGELEFEVRSLPVWLQSHPDRDRLVPPPFHHNIGKAKRLQRAEDRAARKKFGNPVRHLSRVVIIVRG